MTTNEAARIAGRCSATIRNWIANGRLEAGTKPMSGPPWVAWDITEEALAAAIAAQRRPGRPYKTAPKAEGEKS
jgi:DNA-directed RNA polymerase specialized sigma24 family protein